MPLHANTYSNGLNQDIAPTKYGKENYFDLKNFRILTNEGSSSFVLENEKGNKLSFKFPTLQAIYSLKIPKGYTGPGGIAFNYTLPNGNIVTLNITFTSTNIGDIYNEILSNVQVQTDTNLGRYAVLLGADFIYIVGYSVVINYLNVTFGGALSALVVPQQTDLKLIGAGNLRDEIILFTTSEIGQNPTNSAGQIWKIKYDLTSKTVEQLNNITGELRPNVHLKYNNILNFSTYHRIGDEVVCRYENTNTGRVYWTDFYNRLRVANVYDPKLMVTLPEDLDIKNNVSFTKPIINKVGTGSIPTGSTVQYAYRLINTNGAQSIISPVSNLVHLTNYDPNSSAYATYQGSPSGAGNSRSVTYTVKDLDASFNVIEHIVILYKAFNIPLIYKFKEEPIPDNREIEVTHNGNEDYIELSILEFNDLNTGPDKCKSITWKDNRLLAGNIFTEKFDIEFDTRAYRFNSNREAHLYESGDSYGSPSNSINGFSPIWPVTEDLDLINPFNNEDNNNALNNGNWFINSQYKYQSDGVTLGGEGPNIKYSFTTVDMDTDNAGTVISAPFLSVGRYALNNNITLVPGEEYKVDNQFKNFKSPVLSGLLTGYARGEVYRFGVVFYSKKGNPSFVKWIGDIKFPSHNDTNFSLLANGKLKNLGIQFQINNISSIADKISGFEIVRVNRDYENMTKLGTGTWLPFDKNISGYTNSAYNYVALAASQSPSRTIADQIVIDNASAPEDVYTVSDGPKNSYVGSTSTYGKELGCFLSPIVQHTNASLLSPSSDHFIKDYGYFNSRVSLAYQEDPGSDGIFTNCIYSKALSYLPVNLTNNDKKYKIKHFKILNRGDIAENSDLPGLSPSRAINASYAVKNGNESNNNAIKERPLGIGDIKLALELDTAASTSNFKNPIDNTTGLFWDTPYNPTGQLSFGPTAGTNSSINWYWKLIGYERFLTNQYNGNTYSQRSKNQYITTNGFVPILDETQNTYNFKVFGGDVYVNYWGSEYLQPYLGDDRYLSPKNAKFGAALAIPTETVINTSLRNGFIWEHDRDYNSLNNYVDVVYNKIYSQSNNVKQIYYAKDFLSTFTEEHSHAVWASEEKIDGELIDSWRIFKPANYLEVEGIYGPINKVLNFRNFVMFYQSRGIGQLSINPTSVVQDNTGSNLILGTGDVIQRFDYISTETGSYHQFGVIQTGSAIYHFDSYLKKMFKFTGQSTQPLSDLKGLNAFFYNNVKDYVNIDLTLNNLDNPSGIHGVYDQRYNRVLFTFLGGRSIQEIGPNRKYSRGEVAYDSGTDTYYEAKEAIVYGNNLILAPELDSRWLPLKDSFNKNLYSKDFTISFNEFTDSFESFYDYTPKIYHNFNGLIISPNREEEKDLYMHNEGEYCSYYGSTPYPSSIKYLVNPGNPFPSIFNNFEYLSQVFLNNQDVFNETFSKIRVYNDYQDTDVVNLLNTYNIRRRMRNWHIVTPRNNTIEKDRVRNTYTFVELTFDNNNNKRFILHDMLTHYTLIPM
jgi:hypothetical protein